MPTPEDLAELAASRAQTSTTGRPTVAALESLLHTPIPCVDHGCVRVVDYMGDDGAVVQAARVSYGRGTRKVNEDRGLIRYLMRHRHTTPLEMCELKVHVKLPIFVARQWIRHRTASVNEISARYSVLDREFYLPRPEHLAVQSTNNKQGRGEVLESEAAERVLALLRRDATTAYDSYEAMLEDEGLARELARMNLPVSWYTQWYWKVDLHNLLHFLALRLDPHAQYEIRVYGEALASVVRAWVPHCWEAFEDYRVGGAHLSRQMLQVVRGMLEGKVQSFEDSGMSRREWEELMGLLGRPA
jgi:thymidylate synthase (FAD)